MKTCTKCEQIKPLYDYQSHNTTRDGLRPECKSCASEYSKRWRYANLDKANAAQKKYRAANREKVIAYNKQWSNSHPENIKRILRRNSLKKGYGMTIEDFERMVAAQGGACSICQQVPVGEGRVGILHVDHNHRTGAVRALLCMRCNLSIGQFEEDPALLRAAAEYVEFFQEPRHG